MKKEFLLIAVITALFISGTFSFAAQKSYKLVKYEPLSKSECLKHKESLGLKYCPYDNDHLAGAALACGHISKLPSKQDLHSLAQQIYDNQTSDASIYGDRNDAQLKRMGIFINDSHIYYWIGEEANDGVNGTVRMFASKGSLIYSAPRDGSGYVTGSVGKVKFGETKYLVTNPYHDSNLVGLPNNDALAAICYANETKPKSRNKYLFKYVPLINRD